MYLIVSQLGMQYRLFEAHPLVGLKHTPDLCQLGDILYFVPITQNKHYRYGVPIRRKVLADALNEAFLLIV